MIESPIIGKLLAEAEAKAEAKAKEEVLLQVLLERFKVVPDDLRAAILAVKDPERLSVCVAAAVKARSLRKFREATGL
jgi:hypothetical protein